jgi:hypothetical protein
VFWASRRIRLRAMVLLRVRAVDRRGRLGRRISRFSRRGMGGEMEAGRKEFGFLWIGNMASRLLSWPVVCSMESERKRLLGCGGLIIGIGYRKKKTMGGYLYYRQEIIRGLVGSSATLV